MATIIAPSSSPSGGGNDDLIPTATLALPSIVASAASGSGSRRLPPPCWSAEETVALIEAYKDKWYSLRRGNLRANHWQEVADDVASRYPASPAKTAVQCRHKMEKLRKRYRTEIQRAAAHGGVRRFSSSWVHFQRMHSMERGPNPTPPSSSDDEEEEEEDHKSSIKRINDLYSYNKKAGVFSAQGPEYNGAAASGFRIKIPGRNTPGPSNVKINSNFDQMGSRNPNVRFNNFVTGVNGSPSGEVLRDGFAGTGRIEMGKRDAEIYKKKGVDELVAAIHSLGQGFARVEMAKMDMLRKVEEMRMDMEMKRTEIILQSQQKILEVFAQAMSERSIKRTKRSSSTPPE